jgi:hypothetical protein
MVRRDPSGHITTVQSVPPPNVWAKQTAQLRALGAELTRLDTASGRVREQGTGGKPAKK